MLIDKATLCGLIPHAGAMCLLDCVLSWDEGNILCETRSHCSDDNPLRNADRLASVNLAEYGAQAIAVHGGLMARKQNERTTEGYLAALRDLVLFRDFIDDIDSPLHIQAQRIAAMQGNYLYEFEIRANGELLASGCATIAAKTESQA